MVIQESRLLGQNKTKRHKKVGTNIIRLGQTAKNRNILVSRVVDAVYDLVVA